VSVDINNERGFAGDLGSEHVDLLDDFPQSAKRSKVVGRLTASFIA
jgi:hypothetical protein